MMKRKTTETATISWIAVIILRAWDFPFSGLLLIITTAVTFLALLLNVLTEKKKTSRLITFMLLLVFLAILPKTFVSYQGNFSSIFGSICSLALISYHIIQRPVASKPSISYWLILLLAIPTGFLPVSRYHTVFRAGTFESYVTRRFEAGSMEAFRLITDQTPFNERNTSIREQHLTNAKRLEEKGDTKKALDEYDLAIAADPYDADSYLFRGRLRLYKSELTDDIKIAAIKDFTNAIRLDPKSAAAYFYRAQTASCLEPQPDFCKDLEVAISLDSTWKKHAIEVGKIRCPQLSSSLAP